MTKPCSFCGKPIVWNQENINEATGKLQPENPDGTDHRCQSKSSGSGAPGVGVGTNPYTPPTRPASTTPRMATPTTEQRTTMVTLKTQDWDHVVEQQVAIQMWMKEIMEKVQRLDKNMSLVVQAIKTRLEEKRQENEAADAELAYDRDREDGRRFSEDET